MKIVLATGIYPPDIGGPATYSNHLARALTDAGHDIEVISYEPLYNRTRIHNDPWEVIDVPRGTSPHVRWNNYAQALRDHAADADIVYAFSSVSCGVPLKKAGLSHPKKFLRLGGDFFWERYTAKGGSMGLDQWYRSWHWSRLGTHWYMQRLLKSFHHLVFSTPMQQEIYRKHYSLPEHSVVQNAVTCGEPRVYQRHTPFRLLFMGRFVGFKNLPNLIEAIARISDVTLTLTGEGPMSMDLISLVSLLNLNDRVTFVSPVHGAKKDQILQEHDALVIPSVTEISPNVALEARSLGMPVLLSDKTGLTAEYTQNMIVSTLLSTDEIVSGIKNLIARYDDIAKESMKPFSCRDWDMVSRDHLALFSSLL